MANENEDSDPNFEAFRDCFFNSIVAAFGNTQKTSSSKRRQSKAVSASTPQLRSQSTSDSHSAADDPADLADFSDFVAVEVFENLPEDLRSLSYRALQEDPELTEKWSLPLTLGTTEELSSRLPPTVTDSLITYGLVEPPKSDVQSFISPVIAAFISTVTTPPPKWTETRVTTCEICERDWVPITYHHLIPRGVHAKVLKRGWHEEHALNSVAWLCRACHTFVHKMAPNEELAREWFTVDRICSREDVQKWAQWVGRVRWKKR